MMNILKKTIIITFVLGLFLMVGLYIYQHIHEFYFIKHISYSYLCLLLVLSFIYLYVQGVIYNQALHWFNFQLKPLESMGLLLMTILGNYILPFSGLGFRAKYLKKKYQFNYQNFGLSLLAILMIETLVFLFGAMLACFMVRFDESLIPKYLQALIFMIFMSSFLIVWVKVPMFMRQWRLLAWAKHLLLEWERLWSHPSIISRVLLWNVLLYMIFAAMFHLALVMFQLKVSLPGLLLVASLSNLSFVLRLTPASIGTFDGAIIFCLTLFGISIPQGMMVAALIRLATLFWVIFAMPIMSYLYLGGHRLLKNELIK